MLSDGIWWPELCHKTVKASRAGSIFRGRTGLPTGPGRINGKEAAQVSHTGAQETPSAGSDPRCEFPCFTPMSPAIFPGGPGPAPRVRCRRSVGTSTGPFPIWEEGGSLGGDNSV